MVLVSQAERSGELALGEALEHALGDLPRGGAVSQLDRPNSQARGLSRLRGGTPR